MRASCRVGSCTRPSRVACKPGPLALWYPKWIPGTHAPCGPLDTVGGLRLTTEDGKVIPWHRDQVELYRLSCVVPEGHHAIRVELDTICNAPAVDASGHLSYGNASVGIINWPTCLLYPEGPTAKEIRVSLALRLPEGWTYATAIKPSQEKDGLIVFQPVTLATLADSPLIAGEHMRTIPLLAGPNPPAFSTWHPNRPRRSSSPPRSSSITAGWSGRPGHCSEPAITPSFIS